MMELLEQRSLEIKILERTSLIQVKNLQPLNCGGGSGVAVELSDLNASWVSLAGRSALLEVTEIGKGFSHRCWQNKLKTWGKKNHHHFFPTRYFLGALVAWEARDLSQNLVRKQRPTGQKSWIRYNFCFLSRLFYKLKLHGLGGDWDLIGKV